MGNYIQPLKPVFQLLSTTGNGTGDTNATGDYSVKPETYLIKPRTTDFMVVNRLIISIEDAGTFDADSYGNGIALTNGITLTLENDDGVVESLTCFPIKSNAGWAEHCHDLTVHDFGTGNSVMTVRWTLGKTGRPIVLNGNNNCVIKTTLNDDFTGLISHRFIAQGFYQDISY